MGYLHFPEINLINVTVSRQFAAHSPHKTSERSISGSEEENPQTNICFNFSSEPTNTPNRAGDAADVSSVSCSLNDVM